MGVGFRMSVGSQLAACEPTRAITDEEEHEARPSTVVRVAFHGIRCVHRSAVTPPQPNILCCKYSRIVPKSAERYPPTEDEVLPSASRLAVSVRVTRSTVERVALHRTHTVHVGCEGDEHRRHEQLIHAVVEAQPRCADRP